MDGHGVGIDGEGLGVGVFGGPAAGVTAAVPTAGEWSAGRIACTADAVVVVGNGSDGVDAAFGIDAEASVADEVGAGTCLVAFAAVINGGAEEEAAGWDVVGAGFAVCEGLAGFERHRLTVSEVLDFGAVFCAFVAEHAVGLGEYGLVDFSVGDGPCGGLADVGNAASAGWDGVQKPGGGDGVVEDLVEPGEGVPVGVFGGLKREYGLGFLVVPVAFEVV